jgi:hypothetical protein
MPNTRETILTALADLLRLIPFVPVLRGEVLPERVPAAGLIILRDGDPGDPAVTLSPLLYHYDHRAELEVIVQGQTAIRLLPRSAGKSVRSLQQITRSAASATGLKRKHPGPWTSPSRVRRA